MNVPVYKREFSEHDVEASRGIVTSLYYLTKEAFANELDEVADILKETTGKVDAWVTKNAPKRDILINSGLYDAMHFMYLFCASSKEVRSEMIKELESRQE